MPSTNHTGLRNRVHENLVTVRRSMITFIIALAIGLVIALVIALVIT